ncbi:MAG: SDR family oxidoreductase [Thermoleophilia bacterium]
MSGRVAVVTGGSRGLGAALVAELVARGDRVVTDARDAAALAAMVERLGHPEALVAVPGDLTDAGHRARLAALAGDRVDVLVNNAGILGPVPLPGVADLADGVLEDVFAVNTLAPASLMAALTPALVRAGGCLVNLSSDAAAGAYAGWGPYGASKAALDHLTATWAVEQPGLRGYAFDPGDMDTDMHRAWAPGAAGLPSAASVVPAVLALIDGGLPSGRYTVDDLRAVRA